VYAQWMATASAYKVDLHSVNPEDMLVDYTPGACTALRRTGANGLYDPSGSMCFVRVAQSVSPLVPFHLALIPSIGDGQVSRLKKTKESVLKLFSFVPKDQYAPHDADLAHCGTDTLNRLVTALAAHGEDWIAVGKDVGLRASKCKRLYQDAVKILPSLKTTVLAGEPRPPINPSMD
ncbi:hypothetical protein GGI21_003726, partial [Coemansia aciculifera]